MLCDKGAPSKLDSRAGVHCLHMCMHCVREQLRKSCVPPAADGLTALLRCAAGDVVSLGDGRLADGHVRSFFLKEGQTVSDTRPLLRITQDLMCFEKLSDRLVLQCNQCGACRSAAARASAAPGPGGAHLASVWLVPGHMLAVLGSCRSLLVTCAVDDTNAAAAAACVGVCAGAVQQVWVHVH